MLQHVSAPDVEARAARAGLRFGDRSVHTSRTIMLAELGELFAAVSPEAARADYAAAIVDENVLGKATIATRRWTGQRLGELYRARPARRDLPGAAATLARRRSGTPAAGDVVRAGARSALALDGAGRARSAGGRGARQVAVPGRDTAGRRHAAERGRARQGGAQRRQLVGAGGAPAGPHAEDPDEGDADPGLACVGVLARCTGRARGPGAARLRLDPRSRRRRPGSPAGGVRGEAARPDPRARRRRRGRDRYRPARSRGGRDAERWAGSKTWRPLPTSGTSAPRGRAACPARSG